MNSKRVGFFAIKQKKENLLNDLWILPYAIGKGIGNLAFGEIKKECTILGIKEIYIVSDPNAEGFYLLQGAIPFDQISKKSVRIFVTLSANELTHAQLPSTVKMKHLYKSYP